MFVYSVTPSSRSMRYTAPRSTRGSDRFATTDALVAVAAFAAGTAAATSRTGAGAGATGVPGARTRVAVDTTPKLRARTSGRAGGGATTRAGGGTSSRGASR